ncbi:MAG: 3-phosphoshikimate 1-carboxyvinyltransferase [Bilifractor sp.]|nr:3-phosphoshikimate 1-carboxyvinyltransferase [Lachnospiraceae bacterium]MDY2837854.1 3-phosphoshikimate 1-carboxyvinyltransferase [Bilifractor sp.]
MKFFPTEKPLHGQLDIPGDKSISHRAVMFGSLANGTTEITHFLPGADCLSTINCFRKMGIDIETDPDHPDHVLVHGKGLHGLCAPDTVLDCGNSGTTTRLISGILAGQDFPCTLTGDASIQKRPMNRIIEPLTRMGACITSERDNGCAPLQIIGQPLHGITYRSPVASAQVKSCILLAGLYADSDTRVIEPSLSRNHTELMLRHFGASITSEGTEAAIHPGAELHAASVKVPGDISSAAYFLAAACMIPGSEILLRHVGTNPTRDGILRVIQDMGGTVTYRRLSASGGESTADLEVRYTPLHGTVIEGDLIPTLIDELPIIAVLAATAEGQTIIRNAEELKVKESNRLDIIVDNLTRMGADITGTDDGMIIQGGKPLHGAVIDSHLDHRIAMSFAIASLVAEGETDIENAECVNISYPGFYKDLKALL